MYLFSNNTFKKNDVSECFSSIILVSSKEEYKKLREKNVLE